MTKYIQRGKALQMYGGYPEQYGGTLLHFAGVPEQYGGGLGNIFGSVFRRIVPFLFPAVKNVTSKFITSAARNISDGLPLGESLKNSLKDTGRHAIGEVGEIANKVMTGKGRKSKKKSRAVVGTKGYKRGTSLSSLQTIFTEKTRKRKRKRT